MTKIQAIRKFVDFIAGEHVIIARNRCDEGNWTMDIDNPTPRITLPKDFDYRDDQDKMFRTDFVNRCSVAKGFSDVTLTILHEFGHWFNRQVMNIVVYDGLVADETEEEYLSNPYEMLATQWAICWLLCPANRKIAKAFEKDFFGRT
jgi:hypothetical protein